MYQVIELGNQSGTVDIWNPAVKRPGMGASGDPRRLQFQGFPEVKDAVMTLHTPLFILPVDHGSQVDL